MEAPIAWLLDGEPFTEYRTRLDLLGQPEEHASVREAREGMLADPRVAGLIEGLRVWPGEVIASHKSASQPFHRLTFLADLGVRADDPGIDAVVSAIRAHRSDEGPFQIPLNTSERHSGIGERAWAWALCDAPLVVYALARLGLRESPDVRAAVDHLVSLVRDNGWPCAVSRQLGTYRGPGRKGDPCPFATLAMLKMLAECDDLRSGPASRTGADALLSLWRDSRERHPYMFFMGTDFRKLKAPLVWYDLLHALDVLSRLPWLRDDVRLADMMDVLWSKADDEGRFTPESVWRPWQDWEFGQKRVPSRWVTLLAWRIAARIRHADRPGEVPV